MARRLTLVAGSGSLPQAVAEAARRTGGVLQVLDLVGRGDIAGDIVIQVPRPASIIDPVLGFASTHLVFAGHVALPDREREAVAQAFGRPEWVSDLSLAGLFSDYFQPRGIRLVGAHQIAPSLLTDKGPIAGPELSEADREHALMALRVARGIGRLDLGQAVVMSGTRPLAAEDIQGTDALIERAAALRTNGLAGDGAARLILAKAMKPRQPRLADLPAIGPETVRKAAKAGIFVIAVEAGRSLLLERELLVGQASLLGVSVVGLRLGRG